MLYTLTQEEFDELVKKSEFQGLTALVDKKSAVIDALWAAIDLVCPEKRAAIATCIEQRITQLK